MSAYSAGRTDGSFSEGIEVIRTPIQAPNANAYAERWVRTLRTDCLDRILILGRRHLEHVLRVYRRHYNEHRPHRALDLLPPKVPSLSSNRERHNSYAAAPSSADSSTNTKPPREFANPTATRSCLRRDQGGRSLPVPFRC